MVSCRIDSKVRWLRNSHADSVWVKFSIDKSFCDVNFFRFVLINDVTTQSRIISIPIKLYVEADVSEDD